MANVIAVLNGKGGVGKSTISINLARALRNGGDPVLLVDADPQGTVRDWNEAASEAGVDHGMSVVGMDRASLDKDIQAVSGSYRWVVIDGGGKLEKIVAAAVKAADLVLIPLQPSMADFWATEPLIELIQARQAVTDGIPTAAFQVNRAKKGTRLEREAKVVEEFGFPLLNGYIHDRTLFPRSLGEGRTVVDAEPDGQAAWEVNHMVKQIREAFA